MAERPHLAGVCRRGLSLLPRGTFPRSGACPVLSTEALPAALQEPTQCLQPAGQGQASQRWPRRATHFALSASGVTLAWACTRGPSGRIQLSGEPCLGPRCLFLRLEPRGSQLALRPAGQPHHNPQLLLAGRHCPELEGQSLGKCVLGGRTPGALTAMASMEAALTLRQSALSAVRALLSSQRG